MSISFQQLLQDILRDHFSHIAFGADNEALFRYQSLHREIGFHQHSKLLNVHQQGVLLDTLANLQAQLDVVTAVFGSLASLKGQELGELAVAQTAFPHAVSMDDEAAPSIATSVQAASFEGDVTSSQSDTPTYFMHFWYERYKICNDGAQNSDGFFQFMLRYVRPYAASTSAAVVSSAGGAFDDAPLNLGDLALSQLLCNYQEFGSAVSANPDESLSSQEKILFAALSLTKSNNQFFSNAGVLLKILPKSSPADAGLIRSMLISVLGAMADLLPEVAGKSGLELTQEQFLGFVPQFLLLQRIAMPQMEPKGRRLPPRPNADEITISSALSGLRAAMNLPPTEEMHFGSVAQGGCEILSSVSSGGTPVFFGPRSGGSAVAPASGGFSEVGSTAVVGAQAESSLGQPSALLRQTEENPGCCLCQ